MTNLAHGYVSGKAQQLVGFYIVDTFNVLPMITAIESFRIANRVAGNALYKWVVITDNGESIFASNGMEQHADYSINTTPRLDLLFISGPFTPNDLIADIAVEWLKVVSQNRTTGLIGLETGCNVMAAAGLLKGYDCTAHWDNFADYCQYIDNEHISTSIFVEDRGRLTCAGGCSAIDLVLYLIEEKHGHDIVALTAEAMIAPTMRNSFAPQRMNLQGRTGVKHLKLLECIELMESNCEEPLTSTELAKLIGISRRQLERIFRHHLQTSPTRYYYTIRMLKARELLTNGYSKIIDIAFACGFSSQSHFSNRYYEKFGERPKITRQVNCTAKISSV